MKENVLVLGRTGAMGVYTVPELLVKGYQVDVVSMDHGKLANKNVCYFRQTALTRIENAKRN